jgi:hypothetical protein
MTTVLIHKCYFSRRKLFLVENMDVYDVDVENIIDIFQRKICQNVTLGCDT